MRRDLLEQYVNNATRGLYGSRRIRVARELRGNLESRMGEFMAFGDSRERAMEKALLEFGVAGVVARGLREVHVMPLVMKSGAGLVLTLALGMTFISSQAQVLFTTQAPVKVCDTELGLSFDCKQLKPSWVELTSFFKTLDPAARVKAVPRMTVIQSKSLVETGGATVAFGENSSTIEVPGLELTHANKTEKIPLLDSLNSFKRGDKFFVDLKIALYGLLRLGGSPRFNRLLNPVISTAAGRARLGNADIAVDISDFVAERVSSHWNGTASVLKFDPDNWRYSSASRVSFYLKGVAQPSASYALLEWRADYPITADMQERPKYKLITDAVQADARGNLKLVSNQYQLEFASSLEAFKAKPGLGRALVVKLTGRLDKDLLEPKGILTLPDSRGELWKNYTEER